MSTALWPQIIIAISTLAAAIIGYVLAGINDARRDRRAFDRERAARSEDRNSTATYARHHQFQLETLLALQEALQSMARLTVRGLLHDEAAARGGKLGTLPDDLDAEMLANGIEVLRLRNRVLDDNLRFRLEEFAQRTSQVSILASQRYAGLSGAALDNESRNAIAEYSGTVDEIMNHLGAALRAELDWAPDETEPAASTSR
ncbi:hypothetical protein [Microbacterium sp. NPDC056569]|uniref:hypothetical protein n=1 Tax=Microbacterium sp. NPDC056569 TaxID=3345867 RepID=UPI003671CB19